ncbi:MAG: HAD family hydrolase [Actinobacteria bacterium]|nr:HAD family hydrolase [Actinomycetota bacterium]
MAARFDGVLLDAGGVLVLPDPNVLAPLIAYYGGDDRHETYVRAHYAGMAAKSAVSVGESDWTHYNATYLAHLSVPDEHREAALEVLTHVKGNARLWRYPIPGSAAALRELTTRGVAVGIVSNASGQIESTLQVSGICQVGPGPLASVRCVIDSHVVGVEKPDPRIFDHALVHFEGIERSRIAYVGDSLVMDVGGARTAGLHPVLVDPYDDAQGHDVERIRSLGDLLSAL